MCYLDVIRPVAAVISAKRYRPDVGLLTSEPAKHDDELNPRIIAPDPFASDDCLDVFSPDHLLLTTIAEKDTMNTSEDEPLSGLNGRLRPRRSTVTSPHTSKVIRKPEPKIALDRQKRTSTPSKASSTKPDDLANKSDSTSAPQYLCPYCDRKFASKQTASQHARRIHLSLKQDALISCLFCHHAEPDSNDIIRHMVDSHPNQYFACLDCHTRFSSTSELAEHKLNVCEKQKISYRSKLRQKVSTSAKKTQKSITIDEKEFRNEANDFSDAHRFNGVVISCELKPPQVRDEADIEDNITTNLILPPKNIGPNATMDKNAVIVLDDIQWNKRMPANFSFHNTDADQILSRLGVVHRSPRTGESTKKDWRTEEATQKFEKCFDTSFYSKVASNVHENMSKFLDGSFNFNPDPDSIIKTRKSKNSVAINAAEGFPILLACEQYSRNVFDGYMPRALAPKHKWKWENDKTPLNPDDIKHDNHVNNCIITLVSSLDIWTQLCMRRKFEEKFNIAPLEKKTEKQNTISKELKEILESRELPSSSQQVVKYVSKPMPSGDSLDFPASLGLQPASPSYDMQPAVLSGEWVRPRCYVCCACGAQTRDSRGLSTHISTQHPNAQVQHYEIVGELLLNADILKHLYVPPSQMSNRTRPLRGFRECTKCKKSVSLEDLHQHMLDCAGDTPTVRRKCRYRPFGVRRRRTRLPDNTIRKKIRKDIRTRQTRQKTHMRPRPKIRTEVGDAETIRKMLADLPAKRHRVMVNPMNPILRPRRKLDQQRNKLVMKRRSSEILKNRKQRNLRGNTLNRTGSNTGDNDDDKNMKSDDENKPLKPKVKTLKIAHSARQSESIKRKVAFNRAKRRAKIKEQKAAEDKSEQPAALSASYSDNHPEQLSIDNSSQRIDVSGGPYNTREHSSRGRASNHRDDPRPGPSSQDGNTHNSYVQPQNVPLKHSIARLTAGTEMHDNNLQFQHLYLMPPDCNKVTQHVPTGQQRLFENEAVVTKLDKPPLHFNPNGPVDPFACQKSKQCNTSNNKRKGLNDCIAMLKNKVSQTTETSDAAPCSNEDRSSSDVVVATQESPNLNIPMTMSYDTNTRPAEIFSRHQYIPERFIDYHPEANLIAQNFADLPFHYLTNQRLQFDLPKPDSRIQDPRFVKPSKQKPADGNQKTTRRRSSRVEKEQIKRQDYIPRTSAVQFPVNVSTPSKLTTAQSRRASTQSVTVSTNPVVSKRRSSGSYNQGRKTVHDYQTEAILRQRSLEYHSQRISPETHLIELNHSEAYMEAQKNLQKQMIACAENYMNKKQLAVCVDANYPNKNPKALSPEAVYLRNKQATSPGSSYINKKQAAVGSNGSHISKRKQAISPVETNDFKKTQVPNIKDANYFHKNLAMMNNDIIYNKAYATALETDLITKAQASYLESAYVNKKARAVSVERKSPNKNLVTAYKESFVTKSHEIGAESNLIIRTPPIPAADTVFVNMIAPAVSESNLVGKKQVTVATETNFSPKTSPVPRESNFITKKQAAVSESNFVNKKQFALSETTFLNKKQKATSETPFLNKKQSTTTSDCTFVSKKAAALENQNKKVDIVATVAESKPVNKNVLPTPESNYMNSSQPAVTNEPNSSTNNLVDVVGEMLYPENAFNIPPSYQAMSINYETRAIEAPLDLSKNTLNDNLVLSEKEATYVSENFDNYETLDLSHKSLENETDEINDVVDLRVKDIISTSPADICSNLPNDVNMDGATDLSYRMPDNDAPTDLTVKKKTNMDTYDTPNVTYENAQDFVQDLRTTQSEEQPVALSSNLNDSYTPTDLSGRSRDLPLTMLANKTSHMAMLEHVDILKPADLSLKEQSKRINVTSVMLENSLILTDQTLNDKNDQNHVHNFTECLSPTITDESPYVTQTVYSSDLNQQAYDMTPLTTSMASKVQASVVEETAGSSILVESTDKVLPEEEQIVDETSVDPATAVTEVSNVPSSVVALSPLLLVSNALNPTSTSKYESTTPVYTLANACISMSKIGPSNAIPISDAISSFPDTTAECAASVCTLTDTTVNTAKQFYNKTTQDYLSTTLHSTGTTQITTDLNISSDRKMYLTSASLLPITETTADDRDSEILKKRSDVDPETAKKIAMLPKELVEILGTMPVDHRNQLLNVLPQYVSTPAPPPNEPQEIPASTNIAVNSIVLPSKTSDIDVKPALGCSPVSSSQSTRTLMFTQSVPVTCEAKLDGPMLAGECLPPDAEMSKNEGILPRVYEVDGNTVIDLTEEEPINADVKKIIVHPNNSEIIPSNELGLATGNKLSKLKVNDQTASLRAVRIKAPSERNKSLSMECNAVLKSSCQEQQIKSSVLFVQEIDADLEKTSDLDKTLAIQQAEISSTQHNTMTGHCKYPLAISPSSTEYSGDESTKPVAQPSPIPGTEIITKGVAENKYETPIAKTGMVTSSIPTNVINCSNTNNNLNESVETQPLILKSGEAATNNLLLISKSKESDSPICNESDIDTVEKRNVESTAHCTEVAENEDDSEDDMSLAAIIKQKLHDHVKVPEINLSNEQVSQETNKNKKGGKKSKNGMKKNTPDDILEGTSLKEPNDIPIPRCTPKSPELNEDSDLHGDTNKKESEIAEDIEIDKHSKKRPKRGRRPVVSTDISVESNKVIIESDKEINKENDVVSPFINNKSNNDITLTMDAKCAIKEPAPRSHDIVDIDNVQNEVTKTKAKLRVYKQSPTEKDVVVRVRKLSDDMSSSNTISDKGQKKLRGKKKRLEFSDAVSTDKCDGETPLLLTEEINPQSGFAEENQNKSADKDYKKPSRSRKPQHDEEYSQEIDIAQQVSQNIDMKNDTSTSMPLRRSMRGKSLYLENTSNDKDIYESTSELKTPLTKKQLIFSKLRLNDDEVIKPSAHSTPEMQNLGDYESNTVQDEKSVEVLQSSIENPCETVEDKPKGTKRRNSTQHSKKSKKKKSIEDLNQINEEPRTDTSENLPLNYTDIKTSQSESLNEYYEESNEVHSSPQSPVLSSYVKCSDLNVISTEKRKVNNQISFDLSQSSKPKKCKLAKGKRKVQVEEDIVTTFVHETKTACYNIQEPARRARSKSAVIKAGTKQYDPYDIDFEDMAEQNETFKSNKFIGKNNKKKALHSNIKVNTSKGDDRKSIRILDIQEDNKSKTCYDADNAIDSDDSTKSDVPLQKYLEEKAKKKQELEASSKEIKAINKNGSKNNDDKNKLDSVDKKIDITPTEAEEELRSEQFMESFGFFSEKKPRKSNLLASKKIQETINITNESDDLYFGFKEKSSRRRNSHVENKNELSKTQSQTNIKKVPAKRGRKKKSDTTPKLLMIPSYCELCKQEFERSDAYLKHTLSSILNMSKLTEAELYIKTLTDQQSPNILIAHRMHFERYIKLLDRLEALQKMNSKAATRISIPTHHEVVADVKNTILDLEAAYLKLTEEETAFLNCCELLKAGNKYRIGSAIDIFDCALKREESKLRKYLNDDIHSIPAETIPESEKVRYKENSLLSSLRESAKINKEKTQKAMKQVTTPQEAVSQVTYHEEVQTRMDIPQAAVPQREITQAEVPQNQLHHAELTRREMMQIKIPKVVMTEAKIRQAEIYQMALSERKMHQVEKKRMALPHVAILQAEVPQIRYADMTQTVMPQIEIARGKTPELDISQVEAQLRPLTRIPEVISNHNITDFHQGPDDKSKETSDELSSPVVAACHYENTEDYEAPRKTKSTRAKKHIEVKEKMYPDVIEDIDMFEDKFDKIKRKCRSQAAAAKQLQPVVEQTTSYKGRKKSEKKKGKRVAKKAVQQNTQVPTKGALKGFDGIKVSIPTSDINLPNIVPVYESPPTKKKKTSSKRKREKKDSESSSKYDSDDLAKDNSTNKNVDVYEFMDNEDAEFDYRASAVMERIKSINNNKDIPTTSKADETAEDKVAEENVAEDDVAEGDVVEGDVGEGDVAKGGVAEGDVAKGGVAEGDVAVKDGAEGAAAGDDRSSAVSSGSENDDFVYMSDYVASDETESSLMSCETNNEVGNEKKISPQKRKDAVEKSAVMGKIFKNAVRAEKKPPVIEEPEQPKADLDQLFDSLLEDEPNSSMLNTETLSPKDDDDQKSEYREPASTPYDETSTDDTFVSQQEPYSSSSESSDISTSSMKRSGKKRDTNSLNKYELSETEYGPSTSKQQDLSAIDYGPSTSKRYDNVSTKDYKDYPSKSHTKKSKKRKNSSSSKQDDDTFNRYDEDLNSPASKPDEGISTSYDYNTEIHDQSQAEEDTGVARHRARRKCTVGKQNILTETWSSESEPDGGPPRPNSAESVISCVGRKKKGRKKDGHQAGGRRGNSRQVAHKKSDTESRVSRGRAASGAGRGYGSAPSRGARSPKEGSSARGAAEPGGSSAGDRAATAVMPAPSHAVAGPSGVKDRRSGSHYWSGGDEQPEHVQQHGWIVGDSHKKLVTMLAHAKGRKRNDDKRHLVE